MEHTNSIEYTSHIKINKMYTTKNECSATKDENRFTYLDVSPRVDTVSCSRHIILACKRILYDVITTSTFYRYLPDQFVCECISTTNVKIVIGKMDVQALV